MLLHVRTTKKRHLPLPIGRTARIAFEIDAMRKDCCRAADYLIKHEPANEYELEECARLDDTLGEVNRLLKGIVRDIMLGRLSRRSRGNKAR